MEDDKNKEVLSQKESDKDNYSNSFIDKILEFLTGQKNEERIKMKRLKEIGKELSQSKKKYYNSKKDSILPAFADFLYELFRNSQNISKYFDVKNHSKSIKEFLFDSLMEGKIKSLKEKLEKDNIRKHIVESSDPNKAIQEIKEQLKQFIQSFDSEVAVKVNETYNQIVNLSYLLSYDWYFVVHKFDAGISETNFDYKPKFESLDGKYIVDDLIAINDYLASVNFNQDFDNVLVYLKQISSDNSLSDILKKVISQLRNVKKDDYLIKIIQLIQKDPFFKPKNFSSRERIVQDYLMNFQMEIKTTIEESIKEINKNKINKLLMEIFNTTVIIRMKNYSVKINEFLSSKSVSVGLKYIDPLNYIKAFLLDICKGEIKPRIDLLIIKGTWESNALTGKYTELLNKINNLSTRVTEFDDKCSDEGMLGRDLRRLAGILKHDKNAQNSIRKTITNIDAEAAKIIIDCINLTVEIGKDLKSLVEDFNNKSPKMIINFHKIKWEFSGDFNTDIVNIYKKLSNMVLLLKRFVSEKPAQPQPEVTSPSAES